MLKYIQADILSNIDPNVPTVIIHGCNCQCIMGKGLALYLRRRYPGIYEADCRTKKGDRSKLGTFSVYRHNPNLVFLNCYTQFGLFNDRYGNPPVDYDAIMRCFVSICNEFGSYKIRTPLIGCGLAGGSWSIVEKMLKAIIESHGLDVTVYVKGDYREKFNQSDGKST